MGTTPIWGSSKGTLKINPTRFVTGATDMQAVLMSIYRTLKLRGHDPIPTIVAPLG
jgi:hypothetical protein